MKAYEMQINRRTDCVSFSLSSSFSRHFRVFFNVLHRCFRFRSVREKKLFSFLLFLSSGLAFVRIILKFVLGVTVVSLWLFVPFSSASSSSSVCIVQQQHLFHFMKSKHLTIETGTSIHNQMKHSLFTHSVGRVYGTSFFQKKTLFSY